MDSRARLDFLAGVVSRRAYLAPHRTFVDMNASLDSDMDDASLASILQAEN